MMQTIQKPKTNIKVKLSDSDDTKEVLLQRHLPNLDKRIEWNDSERMRSTTYRKVINAIPDEFMEYVKEGQMIHEGESIVGMSPKKILDHGISMSFIPEDRLGMGLAPSLSITDNMILKNYNESKGIFVDRKSAREEAQKVIDKLEIITPSTETPVRRLSGGNVQKVLLGREIKSGPNVH